MGTKINYKSDFEVILHLKDCNDKTREIPFPECDFDVHFWTSSRANVYTASYKDGVYTNCWRTEDGGMHFVFNDHHLGTGVLKWEPHFRLPNDIYPDNRQDIYRPESLDIELVPNQGDCPTTAEVEALAPYIKGDKGDPFTYADFTPEQIEALMKPAVDAARSASATEEAISKAEVGRVKAEDARAASELERVKAEAARASEETQRQRAETQRRQSESLRVAAEEIRTTAEEARRSAEAERESAEESRATEFATWESEIDSKADRSELSNIVGEATEEVIEDLEPTLITTALRKTAQTLTPEEQAQVKQNLNISKMELFIDMWNEACRYYPTEGHMRQIGSYIEDLDVFRIFDTNLQQSIDLSYEEAIAVMGAGRYYGNIQSTYSQNLKIRTNLPSFNMANVTTIYPFYYCLNIEIINADSMTWHFGLFGCPKAHTINNLYDIANIGQALSSNNTLVNVTIAHLTSNLNLGNQTHITLASYQNIVTNAANGTKVITITVHPDVYAKLTDESNTEWYQVLTDAATKNIIFATV